MKPFHWNSEKNQLLIATRGCSFDQVVAMIREKKIIEVIKHPNKDRYPNQEVYILNINNYIYLVPFVEDEEKFFLKTIIPSRKYTKKYLGEQS
jgi:uncharacterized DUF497 family protein